MKTKHWILLILIIFILCLAGSFLLLGRNSGAEWVQIFVDNELLHTLPLAQDRTVTVESKWGTNVVTIRDGKAAVTDASCPDHYCMDREFRGGGPDIVCLPNRLVLHFTGKQPVDTVIG